MPRASREQMALNHERVLQEASRLVRERGAAGVSVAEVMAAAGLTQGGFYKHFASKDDLLAQAGSAAFTARHAWLTQLADTAPDGAAAREQFIADYLSTWHRDHPGEGCAGVALAADAARQAPDDSLHRTYATGVRNMADALRSLGGAEKDGSDDIPDPRALVELATLVGAIVLARATAGDDISERFLTAARDHLLTE